MKQVTMDLAVRALVTGNMATSTITLIEVLNALYIIATVAVALFVGLDILRDNPQNSQALLGIAIFIAVCFMLSTRPSRVNWHPMFWAFVIQIVSALLTLRIEFGYRALKWAGDLVQTLVEFSDRGSAFVLGKDFKTMGLAFTASGVIIFFNCLIFLLNHWGILEKIVLNVGHALSKCLETGPAESVVSIANIFMGLYEAPLLVQPFLATLSKSEICAIMTSGFASISAAFIGTTISFGAPANHLLTAALISAPASLAFSKLIYSETERVNFATQRNVRLRDKTRDQNALSGMMDGATMAMKVIVPAGANILAFVSILATIDAILEWLGERAGVSGLTFSFVCSYVLYPVAYVMGTEPADCRKMGALIGRKMFATPLVAYKELGNMIQNRHVLDSYIATSNGTWHWSDGDIILTPDNVTLTDGVMSERSEVIATYVLCGFSAFPAIGLCLGTLLPLSPSRRQDIINLVLTAFFAGNITCFATGAVTATFLSPLRYIYHE